jgi:hypothetical protein
MTPYFDITHKIKQKLRKDFVPVPKFPDGYVKVVVYDPTTKPELTITDTMLHGYKYGYKYGYKHGYEHEYEHEYEHRYEH